MSKSPTTITFVLSALLLAGCAGDDTVNPLPPPDASTSDASKDATPSDGARAHDAADAKAFETPDAAHDAGEKDAPADVAPVDATSPDASDAAPDAPPADAAPQGD